MFGDVVVFLFDLDLDFFFSEDLSNRMLFLLLCNLRHKRLASFPFLTHRQGFLIINLYFWCSFFQGHEEVFSWGPQLSISIVKSCMFSVHTESSNIDMSCGSIEFLHSSSAVHSVRK